MVLLSTHSDRDGNTHIASFIPGEEKEGWRSLNRSHAQEGGCSQLQTHIQVTPNPQVFPGGRRRTSVVSQHLALGAHAALGEMPCGVETGKT